MQHEVLLRRAGTVPNAGVRYGPAPQRTAPQVLRATLRPGNARRFALREKQEELVVGGTAAMVLFLTYLGLFAVVPFTAGLLGFSWRAALVTAIVLICGFIYLEIITFSHALKYQDAKQLMLKDIGITALLFVELLLAFIVARWLGARIRAGLIRIKDQRHVHMKR
jgi:hypothetical protein